MASIAYITDNNMLELHRLNNHKTMNFWRLSNKINFKNFYTGDLVFFLSKDKESQRGKEKGIVGYGVLESIHLNSVNYMWNHYEKKNGYNSLDEFRQAILKVSKTHEIPSLISSLYLKEVSFFQSPIYLSDCGMDISNNVESFIYLDDEEVTFKILNIAKEIPDLWFSLSNDENYHDKHKMLYALNLAHNKIGDIELSEARYKKIKKILSKYIVEHQEYGFVQNSNTELFKIEGNKLTILLYNDKDIDDRLLYGQSALYLHYLQKYFDGQYYVIFKTIDENKFNESIMNKEATHE